MDIAAGNPLTPPGAGLMALLGVLDTLSQERWPQALVISLKVAQLGKGLTAVCTDTLRGTQAVRG